MVRFRNPSKLCPKRLIKLNSHQQFEVQRFMQIFQMVPLLFPNLFRVQQLFGLCVVLSHLSRCCGSTTFFCTQAAAAKTCKGIGTALALLSPATVQGLEWLKHHIVSLGLAANPVLHSIPLLKFPFSESVCPSASLWWIMFVIRGMVNVELSAAEWLRKDLLV